MALIICPKCGKNVSDRAEKCPHCGCLKEDLIKLIDLGKNDKEEDKYIKLPLAGYELCFDKSYQDYIELRSVYESYAQTLRFCVREYYNKTYNFGTIIENVPNIIESSMNKIIDISMNLLYECNIKMTPEAFIKKYYYDAEYSMDYNRIISNVVEKYADVIGEEESLQKYRNMQKASRSRWEGGGFGLGGAIKGNLMAGVLNAGMDFVRSFGDSAQSNSDNIYIQRKISDLRKSDYAKEQIIDGAYSVIIGVFNAVFNELYEHNQVSGFAFGKECYDKAKNICESVEKYENDEKKLLEGYLDAILVYPYYEKTYSLIYQIVQNTTGEEELFWVLDYFGIEIAIEGIETSTYIDINKYLKENNDLNHFDYNKISGEQFYLAFDIINELKKHYEESVLKMNMRYRKLYDYMQRLQKEQIIDYESEADKKLSMVDYIPQLIEKCIKTGVIDDNTFDGFLWVRGIKLKCEFNDRIEQFNKYIENHDKFLLIYDNTISHMGKRGFGILEDRIVFFETGEVVLFRDIIECRFNEIKISLIIKTLQKTYEFLYIFYGIKVFNFLDKDVNVETGEIFTTKVIAPIIKHYKELYDTRLAHSEDATENSNENNSITSKYNNEEYKYCAYCGRKIPQIAIFCSCCGEKVTK